MIAKLVDITLNPGTAPLAKTAEIKTDGNRQGYCGSCRWCKRKRDGTLICIEVDSEYFSDAVIARNWCERWESKDG